MDFDEIAQLPDNLEAPALRKLGFVLPGAKASLDDYASLVNQNEGLKYQHKAELLTRYRQTVNA
ncbi:hypothetical protein H6770_04370 [Candidatus Peribacteria bacterium]|nr:hypothetical protein [Candidatus Peribacteria bacterium]